MGTRNLFPTALCLAALLCLAVSEGGSENHASKVTDEISSGTSETPEAMPTKLNSTPKNDLTPTTLSKVPEVTTTTIASSQINSSPEDDTKSTVVVETTTKEDDMKSTAEAVTSITTLHTGDSETTAERDVESTSQNPPQTVDSKTSTATESSSQTSHPSEDTKSSSNSQVESSSESSTCTDGKSGPTAAEDTKSSSNSQEESSSIVTTSSDGNSGSTDAEAEKSSSQSDAPSSSVEETSKPTDSAKESTVLSTESTANSVGPTIGEEKHTEEKKSQLSGGQLTGVIFGILLACIAVPMIAVFSIKWYRQRRSFEEFRPLVKYQPMV